MSSYTLEKRNLSIPNLNERFFGIVYSEWNKNITEKLLEGAKQAFREYGIEEKKLIISCVPGAYEVPLMVNHLLKFTAASGIVALGCVIKGDTNHDEYINHTVAQKLMDLSIRFGFPVTYGMVTTLNEEQAIARAGGDKGNKGYEAAVSLLYLLDSMNKIYRV
jgi:6,7-dimethyl-8-ribityllumazine synthase